MKKIIKSFCIFFTATMSLMSCNSYYNYDLSFTIFNTTNEDLHFCICSSNEIDDPKSDFILVNSKDKHTFSKFVTVYQQNLDNATRTPVNLLLLTKEYLDSSCELKSIDKPKYLNFLFSAYIINLKKAYPKEEFEQIISKLTPEESAALLELYYLQDEDYSFQNSFFANLTNDQIELEIDYYNTISSKISEEIQKSVFIVENL